MKRIWKFTIPFEPGSHAVEMPVDPRAIDAQMQGDELAIWCLVDPHAPTAYNMFYIAMTGQDIDAPLGVHVATVQHEGWVGHVFNAGKER